MLGPTAVKGGDELLLVVTLSKSGEFIKPPDGGVPPNPERN